MAADMVEIDVQRTKDGQLVVMHDTNLVRTTDAEEVFPTHGSYYISALHPGRDQARLDAGEWFAPEFDGEKVPTLREALAVLRGGDVGLLLEIKEPARYPGIEKQVAEALRPLVAHSRRRPVWPTAW